MKKIYFLLLLISAATSTAATMYTTPSPIYACDNTGSGFGTFDLTSRNAEILAGADPALNPIRFYLTLSNAGSNTNQILPQTAFSNTVAFNQVIFVRVDDLVNSMMSIMELELIVSPAPTASIDGSVATCVGDFGSAVFTGTGGTPPYTFTYNINGGLPQTVTGNPGVGIVIPGDTAGTYTITLTSVTDSSPSACTTSLNEQYAFVVSELPVIVQPPNMIVIEDPFDGVAAFDLSTQTPLILNGQSGFSVSYFVSEANAVANFNQLPNWEPFTNTENPQQIWASVQNTTTGCFSITSFYLFVNSAVDPVIFIPDPVFKGYLTSGPNAMIMDANGFGVDVDANDDGEIQVSEAPVVYKIQMIGQNINSMEGVNSFTNIVDLTVSGNNLTQLDVSALSNLVSLNCADNHIATINVSGMSNLQTLLVGPNDLTNLNFTNCAALEIVVCSGNQLSSLPLTGLPSLKRLICWSNEISDLNLSGLPLLEEIYCDDNQLTALDFTGLTNITKINCNDNSIPSLDVSNLPLLTSFSCNNNPIADIDLTNNPLLNNVECGGLDIVSLDLSQNPQLCFLICSSNPNLEMVNLKNGNSALACNESFAFFENEALEFVCTDEEEADYFIEYFGSNGMPGVSVNTYCSFVPGGDYNTITGTVKFDSNDNGCDVSDATQSWIKVRMNTIGGDSLTFTDVTGAYDFYTGAGNFLVSPEPETQSYFDTFSPVAVNFPLVDNSVSNQDLCISPNGVHADAEITIAPINPAQPGFNATYVIVFRNKGNQPLTGELGLTFEDNVLEFLSTSASTYSQSLGSLEFPFTNLLPFESRSIYVIFNVNAPTDTPAVNIGDILDFTVAITHGGSEETTIDNTYAYAETVTGSFDPNNVICLEGESAATEAIGEYLHYIINFENTGTAPAQNIVVHQNIDLNNYDIESLQILNSSHALTARIQNGVCEFIFDGISLDSGGHGNILMKIKSAPTLQNGDSVASQANIFFDYNLPVATNVATTTFESLSVNDPGADQSVRAYPNPSSGQVTISANDVIDSIQIYDVQGRLLQSSLPAQKEITLDVSNRSVGLYFLKITTAKGNATIKMIRS
ncbi:MAG TPA: T9SS type A sorting domain-containing protein [Flavobacterium sp.]|jgi:uncharacterized repeat protein (TIGR01451 family)